MLSGDNIPCDQKKIQKLYIYCIAFKVFPVRCNKHRPVFFSELEALDVVFFEVSTSFFNESCFLWTLSDSGIVNFIFGNS